MRITQLNRHYCRECGVETELVAGAAEALDDRQLQCCRLCGSEFLAPSEAADGPVPGLVFPSSMPPLFERGRR